jgi:hypothetical protein
MKTLWLWLNKTATEPHLAAIILQRLREWHEGTPHKRIIAAAAITQAIARQDSIGWWSFLLGRIDQSLEKIVGQHYQRTRSRKKPDRWTANLILQLWDVQWQVWDHRNNINHNHATPEKRDKLAALRLQAQEELDQGCLDLPPEDRQLFTDPDKVALYDLEMLKMWLQDVHLARQALRQNLNLKRDQVARSRELMHAWLSTANPREAVAST